MIDFMIVLFINSIINAVINSYLTPFHELINSKFDILPKFYASQDVKMDYMWVMHTECS